jgi:uncharacterized membrane protein HdeD (DUF308 family)
MSERLESVSRAHNGWSSLLAAGIVLILAGILSILEPIPAGVATGLLLGWALVGAGAFTFAAGVAGRRTPTGRLYLLLGSLALLLGLTVLLDPFAGAVSPVWAAGAWLLGCGFLQLFAAFRPGPGRFWFTVSGSLETLIGALLLIMDPFSALFFLALAVGISLILRGLGSVMLALAIRRRAAAPATAIA